MLEILYRTTDYRRVLLDLLEARGATRLDLAAALDKSKQWASSLLSGRHGLDPELVEPVGRFFGLDAEATAYLAALVDLESGSPRARRLAWATVAAAQAQRRLRIDAVDDLKRMNERWYHAAIAELALCEGWRPDPRWIAATLVPAITEEQAAEALTTLLRLGRLALADDGRIVAGDPASWSDPVVPAGDHSEAIGRQHDAHLELATRGLRAFRENERHYSMLTFPLPEERYEEFVARLRELEKELVHLLLLKGDSSGNRVYRLGIQLLPLSDYTDATHLDDDHST